eukprot:9488689-Pyramimonas_sp.AAC.1
MVTPWLRAYRCITSSQSQPASLDDIHHLLTYLTTIDHGADIMEMCGGVARTSRLAVRRRPAVGTNFDLV